MTDVGTEPPHSRELLPYAILIIGIALTLLATITVWNVSEQRDSARFESNVQGATDRIQARLNTYVTTLAGGAAFFAASDSVTLDQWRAYVDRLNTRGNYPGIQGLGFTRRIPRNAVEMVTMQMRAQGLNDFSIIPTRPREEYHSIIFLEPLDRRNRAALGFDMYTEPTRREAMGRARDTGLPATSGRVVLVQEIDEERQAGFLIYVPVYEGGPIPESVDERRRLLRGFVYSPFRAGDLFAGIFGSEAQPRVQFSVYDGSPEDPSNLLYSTSSEPSGRAARRQEVRMNVAGRIWTIVFRPAQAFAVGSHAYLAPLTALGGLAVSVLLFLFLRAQAQGRAAAERSRQQAEHMALELQNRAAEAEEANRAKSQFLTNMSHELRTPLNAIAGYVELLEMGIRGPVNEAQLSYLDKIKRAQHHLLGQINDVLSFAKIEAGQLRYRICPTPVESTLAELDAIVAPLAERKGLRYLRVPGDEPTMVMADNEKLQQIVLNLLSNSVKFTEPQGEIRLEWERTGDEITIRVSDTGRGIPADRLEAIFEPFIQVEADLTRTSEGTGLGLAISRQLAWGMNGSLEVTSELGEGSTFTLRLPTHDATSDGS